MNQSKINISGISIWLEDGEPRCRPGSIEEALPRIKECTEYADKWIEAVAEQQKAREEQRFTAKQEKLIKSLMKKLKCDRDQAIHLRQQDFTDL
jgi:hypothetical protein